MDPGKSDLIFLKVRSELISSLYMSGYKNGSPVRLSKSIKSVRLMVQQVVIETWRLNFPLRWKLKLVLEVSFY